MLPVLNISMDDPLPKSPADDNTGRNSDDEDNGAEGETGVYFVICI